MRTIVRFSINSLNSIGRKSALEAIANQIAHRRLYHKPYASANRISEYIIAEILNNHLWIMTGRIQVKEFYYLCSFLLSAFMDE